MIKSGLEKCFSKLNIGTTTRFMSTSVNSVDLQNAPFVHYRPRNGENPKFKSPRRRASKLFHELNREFTEKIKESKPEVFRVRVDPGDAVELELIAQGGANNTNERHIERVRGVVIGKGNRGLDSWFLLRDVVYGLPIERRIPIFSPLVKSVKILEKNFIYKGKRKVKRAKLYFLRDRNPAACKVTQSKRKK
mmetsp:Transcript_566/g.872  ORF Transcript_566/g.872 Transcript_566/m.872 type:complete len:192 (-) Transcript_566:1072-1647(-)